jgi:hypothetical protein
MRVGAWLLVAALLVAVACALWPGGGRESPPPAAPAPMAASAPGPAAKPPQISPLLLAKKKDEAAPKRVDLSRRWTLTRQLVESQDLLAFVRGQLDQARAGDGEAQLAVAMALQLCENLEKTRLPDGRRLSAALSDPAASDQQRSMAHNVADRCDPLLQAQSEIGSATDWLHRAERNGVGAAMMIAAGLGPDYGSEQERIDSFRQALASADPAVVEQLIFNSDRWSRAGDAVQTENPENVMAAIALSQCALGYDCSDSGFIYEQLCRRGRCAHADSVQRYYELKLNPQEFAAVQDYAASLVANLRSGRDDWPEAQKLEQRIRDAGPEADD